MYFLDKRKEQFNEARRIERFVNKIEVAVAITNLYKDFISEYKSVVEGTDFDVQGSTGKFEIDIESIHGTRVTLRAPIIGYMIDYELIADKINEIGTNTKVLWTIKKEVDLGKYQFVLSDFLAAELPDEEINMLYGLGKIHNEAPSSASTTSIFCEV